LSLYICLIYIYVNKFCSFIALLGSVGVADGNGNGDDDDMDVDGVDDSLC